MNEFKQSNIELTVDGVELNVSTISRTGKLAPIVFLHGFGSTKEDYADIIRQVKLSDYPFLAYDAPGCGETSCSNLEKVSIPFLVETAIRILEHEKIKEFHLVGHSMGGLTALMLADYMPNKVLSFTDIEGNIAPEDCFLSRQIVDFPSNDYNEFFHYFIERTKTSPSYSSPLYASTLKYKVRAAAVPGIFNSMVNLSDNGNLMEKYLTLPCPKMFMHGDQNNNLSYLKHIESKGVRLSKITECGHFPMYSNPIMMWQELINFLKLIKNI
jgi:pimeloyl-ACP methyl ester carboxylesterase